MDQKLDKTVQEETENSSAPPMKKHVCRFADSQGFFSPSTVGNGLQKIHSQNPTVKGAGIAEFNAVHSGNWICPYGEFKPDEKTGYAKYLHLGTTRIWNETGIDESRWEQFKAKASMLHDDVLIVKKSDLEAYLQFCYQNDPHESNTGRNANSWFSSATVQSIAAVAAWGEVYDRLTCGWIYDSNKNDSEPYITLDMIRLFFEDSEAAFTKAENNELPVSKPSTLNGMTL